MKTEKLMRSFGLLIAFAALFGCAAAVQVAEYDEDRAPKPEGCYLEVYSDREKIERPHKEVGSINVSDTGFSVDCNQQTVIGIIKANACKAGADAIVLYDIRYPDAWSTCFRAKARLLAYTAPEPVPVERTNPPSTANIAAGSCFFISETGKLITNYHVVESAGVDIRVFDSSNIPYKANVLSIDPANDLALLKIDSHRSTFLEFAPFGSLKAGQEIFSFGYPVTNVLGAEPKFTDGVVSSTTGLGNASNIFQMTVPIQPGNSGGPVVNFNGQVVGVATATAAVASFLNVTGTLPQNVNWAVKSEYAQLLAGDIHSTEKTVSRDEAIENARQSICRIEVDTQ